MTTPDRIAEAVDEATGTRAVEKADVRLAMAAARQRDHPAARALGHLSEVADQPPALALGGAAMLLGWAAGDRRLAATGARALLAVALATAAKSAVKLAVARTRPSHAIEGGAYEARLLGPQEGPWKSFPSGHTADAVAAAHAVARGYPGAAGAAWGLAGAIGAAQVARAAHYPMDVAAGALLGWAAGAAAGAILDRAAERLPPALRHRLPL